MYIILRKIPKKYEQEQVIHHLTLVLPFNMIMSVPTSTHLLYQIPLSNAISTKLLSCEVIYFINIEQYSIRIAASVHNVHPENDARFK